MASGRGHRTVAAATSAATANSISDERPLDLAEVVGQAQDAALEPREQPDPDEAEGDRRDREPDGEAERRPDDEPTAQPMTAATPTSPTVTDSGPPRNAMTAAPTSAASERRWARAAGDRRVRRRWQARPPRSDRMAGGRGRGARSPGSGGVTALAIVGGSIAVNRIGSWRRTSPHARLANVSHPSLGLPPRDETAGFPDAADGFGRPRRGSARGPSRSPSSATRRFRERYDELGLRHLLRDTEAFIDRIALAVATDDPSPMREFADQVVPLYRRRRVPMDDLIQLSEGLRAAMAPFLDGPEADPMHAAIDAGIAVMRWNRRIAGDARKRNRLLQAIYKGA